MEDKGASYSMSVGRPKAVIRAEETSGELYSRGGGGASELDSSWFLKVL